MKKLALLSLSVLFAIGVKAQTVEVGGEVMYPKKDIVSNALNSKDHTTLVAAVKAAGLVETLQGEQLIMIKPLYCYSVAVFLLI